MLISGVLRSLFGQKRPPATTIEIRVVEKETERSVSHLEERDWHQLEDSEGRGVLPPARYQRGGGTLSTLAGSGRRDLLGGLIHEYELAA